MLRSLGLFLLWATTSLAADRQEGNHQKDYFVMLTRTHFDETHCNKQAQIYIDTNIRQAIDYATGGEINKVTHHLEQENNNNRSRKLRSGAPSTRRLNWCNEGCNCARVEACQMMYCTDSCGGSSTCACDRRRDLEEEDDEPRFLPGGEESTFEFGSKVVSYHGDDTCGSWTPNDQGISHDEAESFLSCHCEKALTLVAEALKSKMNNTCLGDYISLLCQVFLE
jgi:hypothetical protein